MHLVIVTGLPASGKSTRARQLQVELGYDLISRDSFKEAMADERGCASLEESKALGAESWEMLWAELAKRIAAGEPLIVDADFKGKRHSEGLRSLPGIEAYEVEQVLCSAEPDLLYERFKSRVENGERHFCHFDHERLEHMKGYYANAREQDCLLDMPGKEFDYELSDEKIILRPSTLDEAEDFTRWMNDPEVTLHLGPVHEKNITLEHEREWLSAVIADPDELLFSIFTRVGNKLVGNCAIHFNAKREDAYAGLTFLGIAIGEKDEWGKGYGTSAIQLMLEYSKNNGYRDVYLTVNKENKVAQAVYNKCGFEIIEERPRELGGEEYVMKVLL